MTQENQEAKISLYSLLQKFRELAPSVAKDFSPIEFAIPINIIARFPHIIGNLNRIWSDDKKTDEYLKSLTFADREGRSGFDPATVSEIFFLRQLRDFLYAPAGINVGRIEDQLQQKSRPRNLRELIIRYGSASIPPGYISSLRIQTEIVGTGWGEIGSLNELRNLLMNPQPPKQWQKIGQILVENKVVSSEIIVQALAIQGKYPRDGRRLIGQILSTEFGISADQITKAACFQNGSFLLDLDSIACTHEAISTIPFSVAREFSMVPVMRIGKKVVVVYEEPFLARSLRMTSALEKQFQISVVNAWSSCGAIERRLGNYKANYSEK